MPTPGSSLVFLCALFFIINAFYKLLFRLWDWEDLTLKAVPWNDWVKSPPPQEQHRHWQCPCQRGYGWRNVWESWCMLKYPVNTTKWTKAMEIYGNVVFQVSLGWNILCSREEKVHEPRGQQKVTYLGRNMKDSWASFLGSIEVSKQINDLSRVGSEKL